MRCTLCGAHHILLMHVVIPLWSSPPPGARGRLLCRGRLPGRHRHAQGASRNLTEYHQHANIHAQDAAFVMQSPCTAYARCMHPVPLAECATGAPLLDADPQHRLRAIRRRRAFRLERVRHLIPAAVSADAAAVAAWPAAPKHRWRQSYPTAASILRPLEAAQPRRLLCMG